MNKERLDILATWLEKGAPHNHVKFDMRWFLLLKDEFDCITLEPENACGSVCCIAGCAAQFFAPEAFRDRSAISHMVPMDIFDIAQHALDLDSDQAMALFMPTYMALELIKPETAARTIRHLIKTGIVNWKNNE